MASPGLCGADASWLTCSRARSFAAASRSATVAVWPTAFSLCAVAATHPCLTNSGDPLSLTVSQPRSAVRSTMAVIAAGLSLPVLIMLMNLSVNETLPVWSQKRHSFLTNPIGLS